MPRTVKIALIILVLAFLGMLGFKYLVPALEERETRQTSDAIASKGSIKIGVDNFIGYYPLCSKELSRRMRQKGYRLECIDDGADYKSRYESLADRKIDLAVGTIDSYVLNGQDENYPGAIIAVIDESKGVDAIMAWEDSVNSIDQLKDKENLKIAFTPDSPSHQLLKAISVHFDIGRLKNSDDWAVEANGSEDAREKLKKREVDVAVLWEPDVSRISKVSGIKKILGTETTKRLIVDILVAERKFIKNNEEAIATLLKEYYKTLQFYQRDQSAFIDDVESDTGLDKDTVIQMLAGIEWMSLQDNYLEWFGLEAVDGLRNEGVIDSIESTVSILRDFGSVSSSPLPNRDPYTITNSSFVSKLYDSMMNSNGFGSKQKAVDISFDSLSNSQWEKLREIGTLKVRPIVFSSGSDELTLEGKKEIDLAVESLEHYPAYRLKIKGHTSTRGDEKQNMLLSQDRAESVLRYLTITHGIDENRVLAIGYGGTLPLKKQAGESFRAYQYRLPRVELVLVAEEI
ncbi:phosphate ABC transporter substrate-binding/OmpA family protein [Pleionea sediminis]|uniref:phosphate ABC transporter substrate-binding/OmpA family protein n=1 Tax=Pleionea sediminis TaxID=2569479 RepID=UPI0011858278|nr:phosphate ABC transporter substrate-binding/OmpA family protein [Pleionea sediminis]